MLQKIACRILASFVWFEISTGQIAYFKNDNPFSSEFSSSDSDVFVPSFSQDFSSLVPLVTEKNYQIPTDSSNSFYQAPFLPPEPSSTISSKSQISPISNISPVESFISELNSAVYTSKILPELFDFRELSPEFFSKSLYDYVSSNYSDVIHGDPHYIASVVADPLKEEIDNYTLPIMLDIYGNTFAKYLFAKGTLNSSNASYLAKKFAEIIEDNGVRKWVKETPESKFLVLEDSILGYLKSIDHFTLDTFEDLAFQFANEVKRVAANS